MRLLNNKYKYIWFLAGAFLLITLTAVFSLSLGTVFINPVQVIKILLQTTEDNSLYIILQQIRLPRILLSFMVGSGLAVAGVIFQGIIRNPMVDPYIVGISSGAGIGVTIALILNMDCDFLGISSIPVMAFLGAIITVYIVYNLARTGNKLPVTTFLLAGVAMGFLLNAVMSFLMVMGRDSLHKVVYWLMGSLSSAGWEDILLILPYYLLSLVPILFYIKDLNLILLGDDNANSLGVDVERVKLILIISATLLTAVVVSVSGIIGFVGLIIPHVSRMLIGPDNRKLMPFAALLGGGFLMISDDIARSLLPPLEIPVGIVTAIIGAPYFIYLLRRKKARYF
ncbi:MAG: FecCD family ABC transporter permease [Halanaerobiaceae bacterium]